MWRRRGGCFFERFMCARGREGGVGVVGIFGGKKVGFQETK